MNVPYVLNEPDNCSSTVSQQTNPIKGKPTSYDTIGLLICNLISENQDLEKPRSASNLRKISGPANLDFFSRSPSKKKLGLYHKYEKNQVTN